ncbi:hypothetical protein V8F20_007745 [Naviculisporaceae sp. PSN 640]
MKRRFAPSPQDFLQKQQFRHEQIYCESPHNPEDVLCYGSDDEAYDYPVERRLRIEHQANRFLHGLPIVIASAGPQKAGSQNLRRSHNSVAQTPGRPHKRLRTSAASIPKHRLEKEHPQPSSSRHVATSDIPQDQPSSPVHEYMDNRAFGRVKSWRDTVVKVTRTGGTEVETALGQPSSERTSRLSHRTPREPASSQVVGDSFASSQNVQPSYTQAEKRKSTVAGPTIAPRLPIQNPEPSRSELSVPSLRDYTGLATTPARQSPEQVQPQPISDFADKKRGHAEETKVDGITNNDASSSDLSELSQPTPEAPQDEGPPESVSSGSGASIKAEPEDVVVAPARLLSAVRLQEHSDRSFRFRNVAPRRDLAAETISSGTPRGTPVGVQKIETGENGETTEISSVPSVIRMMPNDFNHDVTLVAEDRPRDESPEDSIVVANAAKVSEAYPSDSERSEVDATGAASLDAHAHAHTSWIDGPTLIPSTLSSDSELSDAASMGNFSCEKQSQALLQEMVQLPRRLLWPKSGKGTADTSLSSDPGTSQAEMTKRAQKTEEQSAGTSPVTLQRSGSPVMAQEIVVDTATTDEGSTDGCSEQTDDSEEEEANIDGGCTTLGTPVPERHEEQSPWGNSQIEVEVLEEIVAEPVEAEEPVDAARHVSPTSAQASSETKSQSPWAKEACQPSQTLKAPEQPEGSPANKHNHSSPFISGQGSEKTSQSPWARGDSQIAAATLPDSRVFNPLSSPARSSPKSPLKEITLPNLSLLPLRDQGEMSNSQDACPPVPSTPEFKGSSLPTPEYTHPIKTFREFLTPSPQKPRKRRRISAVKDGQLPSTQAIVDAAVSNPWLEPSQRNSSRKRKQLRVSWAPLPGEEGGEEDSSIIVAEDGSPVGAEFSEEPKVPSSSKLRPRSILRASRTSRASRVSSPPPQSLPKDLPASEKFGKHFAAMANRRATHPNSSNTVILLSASQQHCDSPPVEAMAERFLAADILSERPRAISILSEGEIFDRELLEAKSRLISSRIPSSQFSTPAKPVGTGEDRDSDVELSPGDVRFIIDDEEEEEEEEEPESLDPVNDVMQNLDSFLDDTWGFGQKESEALAVAGEPKSSGSSSRRRSGGLRSSGVMDTPSLSNAWS